MPIHDQSYRHYGGGKTVPGRSWTVITMAGIKTMIRKRAFLGLLLSTLMVDYAQDHTDNSLAILLANLGGFGILWVAKFFVLDKFLFAATPEEHLEPPPLL